MQAESVSFVRSNVTTDNGQCVVRGGGGVVSLTLSAQSGAARDRTTDRFFQKLTLGMSRLEAKDIARQLMLAADAP